MVSSEVRDLALDVTVVTVVPDCHDLVLGVNVSVLTESLLFVDELVPESLSEGDAIEGERASSS